VVRCGGKLEISSRRGWKAAACRIRQRYCLILGVIFLFVLTLYVPSKIFFISVEGNHTISSTQILDVAERCGLKFGAERGSIRSEQVKNALLQNMPALKWAGINTYGCCAVISVKERQLPAPEESRNSVQGIYAIRDGVISDLTVLKGSAVCKPGEAVRAGQLLISGYTDCNTVIRAQCAEGEVFALTQHRLEGVYIQPQEYSGVSAEDITAVKLIFGKKYINFDIGSGNCDHRCGKLYKRYDLTLPGGFQLPVSLVVEIGQTYETDDTASAEEPPAYLAELSRNYLSDLMLAGQILSAEESISSGDRHWLVDGTYTCKEMIGRLQKEEIRIFED